MNATPPPGLGAPAHGPLVADWRSLGGAGGERPDPYLIWAQLTRWRDLLGEAAATSAGHEPVALLVELRSDAIAAFRAAFDTLLAGAPGLLPPAYRKGRFFTLWVQRARLGALLDPAGATSALILRADLCMPVRALRSQVPLPQGPATTAPHTNAVPVLRGDILLGVIDSGCPFARDSLCTPAGAGGGARQSTRIAALWDMGPDAAFARGALATAVPARLGYGLQVLRDGAGGLDDWLDRCGAGGGALDEPACYGGVGLAGMRSRASHGAHVLDLLAGPLALGQRLAPDADSPPTRAAARDAAADPQRTDIAFVQLPEHALADSSGAWLGSHVLDAVAYLVGCAGAATRHVLINLSYGCTVGPHDGSSIIERALDGVVERGLGAAGRTVEIAIAAGNSFAARGHAVLTPADFDAAGRSTALVWRVLPGSETPSFMQLWLPHGSAGATPRLRITAPDGRAFELEAGQVAAWPERAQPHATAVYLEHSSRGDASPMALVVIAPTDTAHAVERAPAPHGDWTLQFVAHGGVALAPGAEIHAWIARNDHDFGMPLRGRQSFFVDARDEPSRHLRRCADDPGMRAGEIDSAAERRGAVVRRRGTLNGIAGGARLHVCASYRLRDATHAAYSSAGRQGSVRGAAPGSACVGDESVTLRGVPAGGNAGAATFRLVGTSTTAPQRLRQLAAQLAPGPGAGGVVAPPPGVPDPLDPLDLWGADGRLRP